MVSTETLKTCGVRSKPTLDGVEGLPAAATRAAELRSLCASWRGGAAAGGGGGVGAGDAGCSAAGGSGTTSVIGAGAGVVSTAGSSLANTTGAAASGAGAAIGSTAAARSAGTALAASLFLSPSAAHPVSVAMAAVNKTVCLKFMLPSPISGLTEPHMPDRPAFAGASVFASSPRDEATVANNKRRVNDQNEAEPQHVEQPPLSDYSQGILTEASLKGGAQSARLALEWHFEQVSAAIGKETMPRHTPHFCPRRMADMLIW